MSHAGAGGNFRAFPCALSAEFGQQLGAAEFRDHIGPLLQGSTLKQYTPRVLDWYEYNRIGGFDPAEVVDAKVCAFAGWLGWARGVKNTTNKCLNDWTSALNGHFDARYHVRPFNTHYVTALKRKYRDAQLARTLARIAEAPSDGRREPKETRIALPPSGISRLVWQIGSTPAGTRLAELLLLTPPLLFLCRPATVWAFEPGEYTLLCAPCGRLYIVCISRSVKRHPELMLTPDRREIEVPLVAGHPLLVIAHAMFRAGRHDSTWATTLRKQAPQQEHAAARMSRWLRSSCPKAALALPSGRTLSSYSLRIAGVSAMRLSLQVSMEFVRGWGLWRSLDMVERYSQHGYGQGLVLGECFGWAQIAQFGPRALALHAREAGLGDMRAAALAASAGDTVAAALAPPAASVRRVQVHAPPRGRGATLARTRGARRRALVG